MTRNVHASFENFAKLSKKIPQDLATQVSGVDDPARLADTLAASCPSRFPRSRRCSSSRPTRSGSRSCCC